MLKELYTIYLQQQQISIDTRKIKPDTLFFAFRGKNVDGHSFIKEALDKGAAGVIIDNPKYKKNKYCFLVKNVLDTLQQLAKHHRQQLNIPVIGITGSNGKTTTKTLINSVLQQKYRTAATIGNLNNHIGVPLTLLNIPRNTEIAIIEMGANHVGEVAHLCNIAMPTHGLITNIAPVHLEGFKSFEGVLRGKSELYNYLLQNQGIIFVNSQDKILHNMAKRFSQPYFYPQKEDFYYAQLISANPYLTFIDKNTPKPIKTNLVGKHHFNNIAAALCIGKFFHVLPNQSHKAIENYVPQNNRLQIITHGSNIILLDAYNANPVSVTAALAVLDNWPEKKKVIILGNMTELGKDSKDIHQNILQNIQKQIHRYCAVFLLGKYFNPPFQDKKIIHFLEKKKLTMFLKQHLQQKEYSNTLFLIKGSRKWTLEDLVKIIMYNV